MPELIPADSVGLVAPIAIPFDQPLSLNCGEQLDKFQLMVETYGELNQSRSNGVLICHALSGHHHAAGYHSMADRKPGWWDNFIGPGKPIDTRRFFVVALNNLGGCHGSTGPTSINPETGKPYGPDFPVVTVADWVNSQVMLADHLGISQWAAVIGGSLGGMQALQWSIAYPERLRHAVIIASAARLSAQNIAFNEVARQAIMSDDQFAGGRYLEANNIPRKGLGLARMVGHITYLSDDAMGARFGRELKNDGFSYDYNVEFQIESYLRYQGESFSGSFDANTYLLMTRALDYFDPASDYDNSLPDALSRATARFFLASFSTDWRFSPERSREMVDALMKVDKDVTYLEVDAPQGHDAFLMDIPRYVRGLSAYLHRVAEECL
ncbi:homoserine O-acetyltransferase [Endozoicomonas sp. GU-1]|uniref:homoserine O-succinyltransferase MetX n=1 Tax=Endozoicomonas sp. GU-1 TaxID=3009078 RepID=UPI0022B2F70B|nr:homoserine O-acetyltransferase [Endozoicomonas sp. GU-1]WBA81175.1 homoserine O-acetyltransferase [Endozoicomonas sp. GU-1]WBA88740.1 homoserine O-acetyltransferase [Endozoicomonas sp. GU-1]